MSVIKFPGSPHFKTADELCDWAIEQIEVLRSHGNIESLIMVVESSAGDVFPTYDSVNNTLDDIRVLGLLCAATHHVLSESSFMNKEDEE